MKIQVGCELVYSCVQPTPMILTLNVHYSRAADIVRPDHILIQPSIPMSQYRDVLGNWCTRVVAPQGRSKFTVDGVVNDTGAPDVTAPGARELAIQDLPEESLVFLLASRYCETDRLSVVAWGLF